MPNGTLVLIATVLVVGLIAFVIRHRHEIAHLMAPRRRQARINELESQLSAGAQLVRKLTDALNECADQRDVAQQRGREARASVLDLYYEWWNAAEQRDAWSAAYERDIAGTAVEAEAEVAPEVADVIMLDLHRAPQPEPAEVEADPAARYFVGDEELDAWREVADLVPVSEFHSGLTGEWHIPLDAVAEGEQRRAEALSEVGA